MRYDYVLVGAGLFNATICKLLKNENNKCKILVIEKRNHIGGNIWTKKIENINVHMYGAHIFHTSNDKIWNFVKSIVPFKNFINSPIANYKGQIYNLPFNMNTFAKMWNISKIEDAKKIIEDQKKEIKTEPKNLEEQAISLVGRDIYEKLIKGYTEKQWGKDCKELPAFIIKRLPVRWTYNNNYFNDIYQGIPQNGYTDMIDKMFDGADIVLGEDYLNNKTKYQSDNIIYTGSIDEYFNYCFGPLEYRSLEFDTTVLDIDNFQGNAVVNFTEKEIPYTRIIEHKFFLDDKSDKTIITKEFPKDWSIGLEAYYPVNNEKNQNLYEKYKELAKNENIFFAGRLGEYKYYDMDKVINSAFELYNVIKG